jgi:hypothetical protein
MTRNIFAKFAIREDSHNAGVSFHIGNKLVEWKDLTYKEQVKMLNAWVGMYELFYRFLKEEED